MSDSRLRELERRFRATGSPDDEAAWLRARAQAGELTEERLRLLAYLGCRVPDPGAYEAPPSSESPHALGRWVHDLPHREGAKQLPWSEEVFWRVGAALVRAIPAHEVDEAPRAARLLDARIVGPDDAVAGELAALQESVGRRIQGCRGVVEARRLRRLLSGLACAMAPAHEPALSLRVLRSKATAFLAEEVGARPVREALLAELVPWALGTVDPVRERVATTQGGGASD